MLNWIQLHTLIAIMSIIGTIPNHFAKDHLVWALQHQAKPCESDWHGITPTRPLYTAYLSSCGLLWSATMTDHDRAAVLEQLRPRIPPNAPPDP